MKPFKLVCRIMRVLRPVDGFDWKVTLGIRTAKHIKAVIASRIADGTNSYSEGDEQTTYFTTREDAEWHVRTLRDRYEQR